MANCNNLFKDFNRSIKLNDDKRRALRERRENLRRRIKMGFSELREIRYFAESLNITINEEIEFQSQGSFVMDTIINPCRSEDEYDIDDGVYFLGQRSTYQRPTEQHFHDFIVESIKKGHKDNEYEKVDDRNTCVRVSYHGENGDFNYHVDLPIYYASDVYKPELADTAKGWYISNPIAFIVWFEEKIQSGFKADYLLKAKLFEQEYEEWLNDRRKKDHQLRRIVRYLKAWGDNLKGDMPPGVVMTILAASDSNYQANDRDDICLRDTLKNIRDWLDSNGFCCPRPTIPVGEDLFSNYSQEQKLYFKNALDKFIASANQAINSQTQREACPKWQKHLGNRFPCHLASDEIEGSKIYATPSIIRSDNSRSA